MVVAAQYSIASVQVLRLLPFGLLVRLDDGREGIIRERELAWEREGRRNWREHFAPGERLSAVLLASPAKRRPNVRFHHPERQATPFEYL